MRLRNAGRLVQLGLTVARQSQLGDTVTAGSSESCCEMSVLRLCRINRPAASTRMTAIEPKRSFLPRRSRLRRLKHGVDILFEPVCSQILQTGRLRLRKTSRSVGGFPYFRSVYRNHLLGCGRSLH